MSSLIKDFLRARDINPCDEQLQKIALKWKGIQSLKTDLGTLAIDDADISLRSIPGGDHIVD